MASKKKSAASARPSGAQPGNRNAFKHGFYAKQYFPLELSDLSTALGDGLSDEIALLRVIIRRVFDFANDHENQDLNTWSSSLNTLGAACTRLAGLLRTDQVMTVTLTTPAWLDDGDAYYLKLVVNAALTTDFTFFGARANYDLRV